MAKNITMVVLETTRDCYGLEDIGSTMTIRELKERLEDFDDDMQVVFSNDGGYTYGEIRRGLIHLKTETIDEDEED